MPIGENIKKMRNEKKIKQISLASNIDISVRTLQKYESGEIVPSIDKVQKLAAALEVPVSELLGIVQVGTSKTFVNNEGKITHVYPTTNIEKPVLSQYDDITLISEYIGRRSDSKGHIISNWGEIIKDVNDYIDGKIAKGILYRGSNID